jgi:hypothetical protein
MRAIIEFAAAAVTAGLALLGLGTAVLAVRVWAKSAKRTKNEGWDG